MTAFLIVKDREYHQVLISFLSKRVKNAVLGKLTLRHTWAHCNNRRVVIVWWKRRCADATRVR